jgi:uncharacterized NAD(P)/FAD-binding protein YdhS
MKKSYTIAIVGGGVSGSLTAYHLAQKAPNARVLVIEPKADLGLGLAYSTPSLQHLLNVPAGKISALPDRPEHFLDWLHANYDSSFRADDFAPRAIFGRYIQSLVAEIAHRIEHISNTVSGCDIVGGQAVLRLEDGTTLTADAVVLATGNFNPAPLPGISEEAVRSGSYCHSAWDRATYENLSADAPVALIGTGLTAVDVLLRLREFGHRGTITAISRHGVFPNRHAAYEPLPQCVIAGKAPEKAYLLLRAVRRAIREGKSWRAVIDSLRPRTNELWLALSLVELRRFRRHLQRRWDVVRHRMAPAIADRIECELASGTLVKHSGNLQAVFPAQEGVHVQWQTACGKIAEMKVARVINCTGPDMNYRRVGSALLNSLFAQGLATRGPLGGGLWSDEHGALRASDGSFSSALFHVGPGRQGTLIESIAVPELREQAYAMACRLSEKANETSKVEIFEAKQSLTQMQDDASMALPA